MVISSHDGLVSSPFTNFKKIQPGILNFFLDTPLMSVSRYTFMKAGSVITWGSKKQNSVSLSSTEAEYICLSDAAQDALWL